jgi:hypothetical protein
MEIKLKASYYGAYIIVDAENVHIEDYVTNLLYPLKEDGTKDLTAYPQKCIKTDSMNDISGLMYDMVSNRTRPYDSSDLILRLFDKLPDEVKQDLIQKLKNEIE